MKTCSVCGKPFASKSTDANNPKANRIYVLTDMQLLWRDRYQSMARYVAGLPISSREVPNWIADRLYEFEGEILWPDGTPFEIGDEDIDQAFNDDLSFRWVRSFRQHAHTRLKQRPQERLLPRLRLIALAIHIDALSDAPLFDSKSFPEFRP